ncbi:MAG: hypothetical protein PHP06_09750 [Clostridia bacterium]|nr:hypothetical protein [Clostridia bacterium]
MSNVLFSAVGFSDPIRNNYDGSLLHIVRYYRPDTVYLLLTEEVAKLDKKDDRYAICIKKIIPDCKIVKYYTSIKNAHDFDAYFMDFRRYIQDIYDNHPEDNILLNVSSGTPQIKATLCLEAVTSDKKLTIVQVSSPAGKSNHSKPAGEEFDVEYEFANNLDNLEDTENRTMEPDILSFRYSMIRSQMRALVNNYEYQALLNLMKVSNTMNNQVLLKLINHAVERKRLNAAAARGYIQEYKGRTLFPVKDKECADIVEYFLLIKLKQKAGQYTEMVLFLNPISVELLTAFIKYKLNFDIDSCIKNGKWNVQKIRLNSELCNYLTNAFGREIESRYISIEVLHKIAEFILIRLNSEGSLKNPLELFNILEFFDDVVKLNRGPRNEAAHELTQISAKDIKDKTGMQPKKIIREYEKIIRMVFGSKCPKKAFDIYDCINDYIKDEMEKSI